MADLKPCPFCGGKASSHSAHMDERMGYQTICTISCLSCKASVSGRDTLDKNGWANRRDAEAKAMATWNTRADPLTDPRVVALVEALGKAADWLDWCASTFPGPVTKDTVHRMADEARAALRAFDKGETK